MSLALLALGDDPAAAGDHPTERPTLARAAAVTIIALGIGYVIYRMAESPARSSGRHSSRDLGDLG